MYRAKSLQISLFATEVRLLLLLYAAKISIRSFFMKLSRHPSRGAGRDLHIITQEAEAGDISDGGKFLTVFCTPR